jgi:predicted O-methyltransferase YrrM
MNLIKSILKNVLKIWLGYKARMKLRKLRNITNPAFHKVANAVNDALKNILTSEEKVWVERIEEVRSALNASSMEISVTDYGAGKPNLTRTKEDMYQGLITTMTVSSACKASKSFFWALVLFKLVREFKPSTCIELGTCLGISAAYQAAALKLNNKGRIVTLEGADTLASLSRNNLQKLSLDNVVVVSGRFQDNLQRILHENEPIDFAFIDGHHDEKATISYFKSFIPHLSKKSVIIFDDIAWSDGMRRAWKKVIENENVKVSVNLRSIGICVLDNDIERKSNFQIPLM